MLLASEQRSIATAEVDEVVNDEKTTAGCYMEVLVSSLGALLSSFLYRVGEVFYGMIKAYCKYLMFVKMCCKYANSAIASVRENSVTVSSPM